MEGKWGSGLAGGRKEKRAGMREERNSKSVCRHSGQLQETSQELDYLLPTYPREPSPWDVRDG